MTPTPDPLDVVEAGIRGHTVGTGGKTFAEAMNTDPDPETGEGTPRFVHDVTTCRQCAALEALTTIRSRASAQNRRVALLEDSLTDAQAHIQELKKALREAHRRREAVMDQNVRLREAHIRIERGDKPWVDKPLLPEHLQAIARNVLNQTGKEVKRDD